MFEFIIQALEGVFTIIVVVGIGYFLSKKGWLEESSSSLLSNLVTKVSLPFYLIASLTKNFTLDQLIKLAPDMFLPVSSVILAMLLGYLAVHIVKIRSGRRGIFCTNFFIANTMFIGLPVNLALFGDESIPSVMLYYMVNTLFFWTLGIHSIAADISGEPESFFSKKALKKMFSPPLVGFIVALTLIIFNVQLPVFLFNSFRYIGNLTTPLSLIFIGIEISKISLHSFRFERDILWGLAGRFIVCPVCVLLLVPFFTVSPISAKVFTMQASMPAMTQMAIMAKQYGADSRYAAALSFITILAGIFVIPFYMAVVNMWF